MFGLSAAATAAVVVVVLGVLGAIYTVIIRREMKPKEFKLYEPKKGKE